MRCDDQRKAAEDIESSGIHLNIYLICEKTIHGERRIYSSSPSYLTPKTSEITTTLESKIYFTNSLRFFFSVLLLSLQIHTHDIKKELYFLPRCFPSFGVTNIIDKQQRRRHKMPPHK